MEVTSSTVYHWKPPLIQLTAPPNRFTGLEVSPIYLDPSLVSYIAIGRTQWNDPTGARDEPFTATIIWLASGLNIAVTEPPQRVNQLVKQAMSGGAS